MRLNRGEMASILAPRRALAEAVRASGESAARRESLKDYLKRYGAGGLLSGGGPGEAVITV